MARAGQTGAACVLFVGLLAARTAHTGGLGLIAPAVPETPAVVENLGRQPLDAAPATLPPAMDIVEGGAHWRVDTIRGPVHLWQPAGYAAASAGVVVYVHGYRSTVDEAWTAHSLAAQFRASNRNALFIVPEAPTHNGEEVRWPALVELLDMVPAVCGIDAPKGPVVAIGHSGGFRTIEEWLGEPAMREIILLDGLYADSWPLRSWLASSDASSPRHLTLVGRETRRHCRRMAYQFHGAVRLPRVPVDRAGFGSRASSARLLVMDSQYRHMTLVTGGQVIPLLLKLSELPRIHEEHLAPRRALVSDARQGLRAPGRARVASARR
jgi:hypothetical protein